VILRPVIFTLGFALGAAAQAVAQLATPAPTPQIPPASAAPEASPSPAVPTPTPAPTGVPATATPSPYKYVVNATPNPNASPGAPQILRIEVNDQTIHPGGPVAIRVTTTPDVKTMIATAEGHDITIPKAQDGLFAGMTTLPSFIPFWMLKTYQVTFTGISGDGRRAAMTIPVTLR
jgi:hypothetical protein